MTDLGVAITGMKCAEYTGLVEFTSLRSPLMIILMHFITSDDVVTATFVARYRGYICQTRSSFFQSVSKA